MSTSVEDWDVLIPHAIERSYPLDDGTWEHPRPWAMLWGENPETEDRERGTQDLGPMGRRVRFWQRRRGVAVPLAYPDVSSI